MAAKAKFAWTDSGDRSVFELVTEDGTMGSGEVFQILQKLCTILEHADPSEFAKTHTYIRPQNIVINTSGNVQLVSTGLPLPARDPYAPPEQDPSDGVTSKATVYALGMLMLFLATGHENKSGMDSLIKDKTLRAAIERCTAFDPKMRFQTVQEFAGFIKHSRRNTKHFLIALLVFGCIGTAVSLSAFFWRQGEGTGKRVGKDSGYSVGYVSGYEKGFSDAPGIGISDSPFDPTRGNLPGNSSSGAFAVRSEDEIFFLLEGGIYRMDPYTKKTQVLMEDANARNLNYYEGWLYYSIDQAVLRINPDSQKQEIFCDSKAGMLYIAGGEFYLDDAVDTGYLYKINLDGTLKQLNSMTEYHCLNIFDRQLYFSDTEHDSSLYRSDLDGGNLSLINSSSCEWFTIFDNKIYGYAVSYEDYENSTMNPSASFLVSMDLDGGSIRRYSNMPAYYINVTQAGIFYVAGNNRTLEWMSMDGSVRYTIVTTHTGPFNITGRWIFYQNDQDGGSLWRVRIDGSDNERVVI